MGDIVITPASNDVNSTAGTLNIRTSDSYPMLLKTSNVERISITAAGLVGIGTTAPTGKLHVYSSITGDTLIRADGTNGTIFSVTDDLSNSLLSVNNSAGLPVLEVFADDSVVMGQYGSGDLVVRNNKVGIGTTSPNRLLEIKGSNSAPLRLNTSLGNCAIEFLTSPSTYSWLVGGQYSVNNSFEITPSTAVGGTTFSTPSIVVKSDGTVGIGITNPNSNYKLDLSSSNDGYARQWIASTAFVGTDNGTNGFQIRVLGGGTNGLKISNSVNNVEYVRISSDGKVGIGTIAPTGLLTIHSNATQLRLQTADGPGAYFTEISSLYNSTHPFSIGVANNSASTAEYFGIYADGGGSNNRIALLNGNVGIGTTVPTGLLNAARNANTAQPIAFFKELYGTPPATNILLLERGNNLTAPNQVSSNAGLRIRDHSANYSLSVEDHNSNVNFAISGTRVMLGSRGTSSLLNIGGAGSATASSGITFGEDAQANLYRLGEDSIKTDGNLYVAGDTLLQGNKYLTNFKSVFIFARGTGANNSTGRALSINDTVVYNDSNNRGLRLTIINAATLAVVSTTDYDTYGSDTACNNLATAINGMTSQQIGVLTSFDAWERDNTNLKAAALNVGLTKLGTYSTGAAIRKPYAAIFNGTSDTANATTKHVIERMESSDADATRVLITTYLTTDGAYASIDAALHMPNALYASDADIEYPIVNVNSIGNVGIGTTSPAVKLQVEGDQIRINTEGSYAEKSLYFRYSNNAKIMSDSYLTFLTSGTPVERMRIDTIGNIGIGTNSASERLQVNDVDASVKIVGTIRSRLNLQSNAGGWQFEVPSGTVGNVPAAALGIVEAGVGPRVSVLAGGNVGIGLTNPTEKLHVTGYILTRSRLAYTQRNDVVKNGLSFYVDFNNKTCFDPIISTSSIKDISNNNYSLSLVNAATISNKDGNTALYTANNSSYLQIASYVMALPHTWEAWVNGDAFGTGGSGWDTIWDSGGLGIEKPLIGTINGVLNVYPNTTNCGTLTAGKWYHIIVTADASSNVVTYINGVQTASFAYGTTFNVGTGAIWLGGDNSVETFNGYIPIARTYNRVLSATEVMQNYNAEKWRFDNSSSFYHNVADGTVGLSTTTPSHKLHVYARGNGAGILIESDPTDNANQAPALKLYPKSTDASERNWSISPFRNYAQSLSISSSDSKGGDPYSNATTRLIIDGINGNVGIGTINPAYKLDVSGGSVRVFNNPATNNWGLTIENTNAGGWGVSQYFRLYGYNSTPAAAFDVLQIVGSYPGYGQADFFVKSQAESTAADVMSLLGNGRVGIGTNTPTTLLSVGGPGSTSAASGITLGGDSVANLYRSAASTIKTDGSFVAAGNLTVGNSITASSEYRMGLYLGYVATFPSIATAAYRWIILGPYNDTLTVAGNGLRVRGELFFSRGSNGENLRNARLKVCIGQGYNKDLLHADVLSIDSDSTTEQPILYSVYLNGFTSKYFAIDAAQLVSFSPSSLDAATVYYNGQFYDQSNDARSLTIQAHTSITGAIGVVSKGGKIANALFAHTGNIGIGIAVPSAKLEVNGPVFIPSTNGLYLGGTAGSFSSWQSIQYANGGYHVISSNGLIINNAGYSASPINVFTILTNTYDVGLSTNAPAERLHVYKTGLANNSTNSLLLLDGKFTAAGVDSDDIVGIAFRVENAAGGAQRTTSIASSYQGGGYNALLLQHQGGNVGVSTNNPSFKFDNYNDTIRTLSRVAEKIIAVTFPHNVANQKVDIIFDVTPGTNVFWGNLEVEITDGFSNELATGKLIKVFALGLNPATGSGPYGSAIYDNTSYYTAAYGAVANNYAIDGIFFNTTTGKYYLTIIHRTSTGNTPIIKIKGFTTDPSVNAVNINNLAAGAVYTTNTTTYYKPVVETLQSRIGYNGNINQTADLIVQGNVGIGTTNPSYKTDIAGPTSYDITTDSATVLRVRSTSSRYPTFPGETTAIALTKTNEPYGWRLLSQYVADTYAGADFHIQNSLDITPTWGSKLTILRDGKVGIGITNPTYTLQVAGTFYVNSTSFFNGAMTVEDSLTVDGRLNGSDGVALLKMRAGNSAGAWNDVNLQYEKNSSADSLHFNMGDTVISDATVRLTVQNNGNIGIGTTRPAGLLHAFSSTGRYITYIPGSVSGLVIQKNASISSQGTTVLTLANAQGMESLVDRGTSLNLDIGYGGSATVGGTIARGARIAALNHNAYDATAANQNAYLAFYTATGGSLTEKLRIHGDGKVGIGTASPYSLLDVQVASASPRYVTISTNDGQGSYYGFGLNFRIAGNSHDIGQIRGVYENSNGGGYGGLAIATRSAGTLYDRVSFTDQGRVGIGTSSPTTLLSVGGLGSTTAASGITFGGDSVANLYRISASRLKTDGSITIDGGGGNAQALVLNRSSTSSENGISFNTAGSTDWYYFVDNGTTNLQIQRGNEIDSAPRVRFNGSNSDILFNLGGGNIGVGTATPTGKLHIYSTITGQTLLRADGTNGTIFSVIDDLSNSLLSVNNSAGIPVLEVFADDSIVMGQYGSGDLVVVNNEVGIGTTNPINKLSVIGNASIGSNSYNVAAPTNGLIVQGNVGIGLTNPSYKLDVNGNANFLNGFYTNTDAASTSYFVGANGTRPIIFQNNTSSAYDFGFKFTDSNTFTIVGGNVAANPTTNLVSVTFDGNVGIGITTPQSKLDVRGTLSVYQSANSDYIYFDHAGINTWRTRVTTDNTSTYVIGNDTPGVALGRRILNITNAGNLGIGVVSPATLLGVGGAGSTVAASGITLGADTSANLYRSAASTIKTDGSLEVATNLNIGADLYVADELGVGVTIANKRLNYGAQISAASASIQLVLGRTASSTGQGAIGADASSTFAVWNVSGGATRQFNISQQGDVGVGNITPTSRVTVGSNFASLKGISVSTDDFGTAQFVARKAASKCAYGILAWENQTYLSAGIYYDGSTWTHHNANNNNQMQVLDPGNGTYWYASNNGAGSWNVANAVPLWDDGARWKSSIRSTRAEDSYISGGSLALGTDSVSSRLTVLGYALTANSKNTYAVAVGNANNTDLTFGADGSYAYIQSWGSKPLYINNQGNNVLVNSNVGIGTLSPSGRLHVNTDSYSSLNRPFIVNNGVRSVNAKLYDTAVIQQDDVTSLRLVERNTAVANQILSFSIGDDFARIACTAQPMQFYVNGGDAVGDYGYLGLNGTKAIDISTTANVGIGNVTPNAARLHIKGDGSNPVLRVESALLAGAAGGTAGKTFVGWLPIQTGALSPGDTVYIPLYK